jgi:hypothetical protein
MRISIQGWVSMINRKDPKLDSRGRHPTLELDACFSQVPKNPHVIHIP